MTSDTDKDASQSAVAAISDPTAFHEVADVPVHKDTDVAPPDVVNQLADAPDMAIVGVENDDGAVLLRRLTDTCAWKLPVATVEEDEAYGAAVRDHVTETIGALELEAVEGVWSVDVRSEDGDRTASRTFAVFSGTLAWAELSPPADGVAEAGWFEKLPESAEELPGTDRFFD